VVGTLDRHPVLERLEADRVVHLIAEQVYARRIGELQDRIEHQEQREDV
jgi:predicted GNAT superfamily acetyltransferase